MVKILSVIKVKKYIFLIIVTIVLSAFLGFYLYKLEKIDEQIAFEAEYTTNKSENVINEAIEILERTSSIEDKINLNTKIIEKIYYNECEHIIEKPIEVSEKNINKTEAEFQIEYIGWEIQKFTTLEVVVYKEVYDFCNEHYILKDEEGYLNVYKLDKYDNIKELFKKTEIQTEYLSEVDLEDLKKGIIVYGRTELNKRLEDFE